MSEEDLIITLDLETTGLDPASCGILEIGAVLTRPDRDKWIGASFHRDVAWEPWETWEIGAEKVHGLSQQQAGSITRYSATVAMHDLLGWIDDLGHGTRAIIAGMNPQFDLHFLRALAVRENAAGRSHLIKRMGKLISHRTIDLHTLAMVEARRRGRGIAGLNTDEIYGLLGMAPEPQPHRALVGATMEAEAVCRLLTGCIRTA